MSLINQFFSTDHRRLDCLFLAFKSDLPKITEPNINFFNLFKKDLKKHIAWEEKVLFPYIESILPMAAGPINVMCSEHELIINLLSSIDRKLKHGDTGQLPEVVELERLLSNHNMKEEHVLYPLIDENIDQRSLAKVFSDLPEYD
ncbi:hemerythrin domain-containing protein [Thalassotalea ganghwensis]